MRRTTATADTARRFRLPGWFAGEASRAPISALSPPVAETDAARVQRKLFGDIGDFLFVNGLTLAAENLHIAHDYVSGIDPALRAAIGSILQDDGQITDADMDRITRQRVGAVITPDMLAELAAKLETRMAECLATVGRSCLSAQSYGAALDSEAARLAADATGSFDRLAGLTREMVARTRLLEGELQETRRETDRLKSSLNRARRAAERDHLTGLPNRRCFEGRLRALGGGEAPVTAHVALCDIDDFKAINDRHGHEAGDRVLKFFARFLKTELGGTCLVARYGGEEFACLFETGDRDAAITSLDQVRERLMGRSLVNQQTGAPIGTLTFSAGVAAIGDMPRDAVRNADLALYAAKRSGKNKVVAAAD